MMGVMSKVSHGGDGKESEACPHASSRFCRLPLVALCGCHGDGESASG